MEGLPARRDTHETSILPGGDSLSSTIVGVSIALGLLTIAAMPIFGSVVAFGETRPVAELPWFLPVAQAFVILSALAIAFLCAGRYLSLGGAQSLWIGAVFLANGVLSIFYLLSWPGLIGNQGLIGQSSNTASWFFLMTFSCLALLLPGINSRQEEKPRSVRSIYVVYGAAGAAAVLVGAISLAFENVLPQLVSEGNFTPLVLTLVAAISLLLVVGAILSYRRYRAERDIMLGYVALFLTLMAFGLIYSIMGGKRYDVWWYAARALYDLAYVAMLFGLLQEGYTLFVLERSMAGERELLMERVQESEHRYRSLFNSMSERFVLFRVLSDETGIATDLLYLDVNPAHERLSGFTRSELVGKCQSVVAPGLVSFWLGVAGQVLGKGEPLHWERYSERFDAWGEVRAYSPGKDLLAVVTTDITERKRAEQERERLLASEQEARSVAEKAVKVRDEFISIAAHELKTPVTSLQGYAQMLVRQFSKTGSLDPVKTVRSMERIEQQSKRLTRLTEQLLNLSRLESGRLALATQETDVGSLVQNLVEAIRHSHPDRVIELRGGQGVSACLDPLRMEQVVTNLVDNALKFSPGERPVEVEVGVDGTGWVRISVLDHGVGIPESSRKHIFEKFFQAHPERHYGGMGIGLFISRQIVELHGGAITFEQPEDGGSLFVIRVPVSSS